MKYSKVNQKENSITSKVDIIQQERLLNELNIYQKLRQHFISTQTNYYKLLFYLFTFLLLTILTATVYNFNIVEIKQQNSMIESCLNEIGLNNKNEYLIKISDSRSKQQTIKELKDQQMKNKMIVSEMKDNFKKNSRKNLNPNGKIFDQDPHITSTNKQIAIQYIKLSCNEQPNDQLIQKQRVYFQQKYKISAFTKQLPICLVVTSYNNANKNRFILHLNSLMRQRYNNFRIIYIDDASPDQTGKFVQRYRQKRNISTHKLTIIINQKNKKSLLNQRIASNEYCKPHQIYFYVAGDDLLSGVYALQVLNVNFQISDAWIVYANAITTSSYSIWLSRGFLSEQFLRERLFRSSFDNFNVNLGRAFYNQLFRQIKEKDLQYENGTYIIDADDRFIVYPIVEMAELRMYYLPQVLYIYNDQSEHNAFRQHLKTQSSDVIYSMSKDCYQKLQCLFRNQKNQCSKLSVSDFALQKSGLY